MYLLLLFSIFLLLVVRKLLNRYYKIEDRPPALPGAIPFFGHALKFLADSKKNYKNIIWISQECLKKGGVLSTHFGFIDVYCITDPHAMETVFQSCFDKIYIYGFIKTFVGNGLVTSSGSIWKNHRKLINPAFSQPILNSFIPCFNSQARRLVEQLASRVDETLDHENILKMNNLETVCKTATGLGGDEYSSLQAKYIEFIPKFQLILNERIRRYWYHSDFLYKFSNLKKKADATARASSHFSKQIIQKKKQEMSDINDTEKAHKIQGKMKPFLEHLLNISNENSNANNSFTDEEIRSEIENIIAAGQSPGIALNVALVLLGSYPDIQEKLYTEIIDILGNSDRDLDKSDLDKLVYTEAVLKETLRLHPPIPVVARQIQTDIKLENYTLKANSVCFLLLTGVNRHPAWGPDADQFKPERWLNVNTLPGTKYFGSFTNGNRFCIGKKYAMMSMKTTLAHVIRNYHISADISKVEFKWHMAAHPASGHQFLLKRR